MSSNKKRKLSQQGDDPAEITDTIRNDTAPIDPSSGSTASHNSDLVPVIPPTTSSPSSSTQPPLPPLSSTERLARFAALRARATDSARSNLAAAKDEAKRTALDPTLLSSLSRRSAIAQHNLLKADTEESEGTGAFERKRAWDYTVEESEKWDERVAQKKANKDNNAFQDWGREAGKIYDRHVRDMEKLAGGGGKGKGRLREEYNEAKQSLLESAARTGNLEIVELDNGEMVAIDKEGRFYADHDSTGFVEQRPKKENVDRLVEDLRKAEEARMKKRRARGLEDNSTGGM